MVVLDCALAEVSQSGTAKPFPFSPTPNNEV